MISWGFFMLGRMLPRIDPSKTDSWKKLLDHFKSISSVPMRKLFEEDAERVDRFSRVGKDYVLDFSKHRITKETLTLLKALAEECQVEEGVKAMFEGQSINETEGRAVLHTALRDGSQSPLVVDGQDIRPLIAGVKARMRSFSEDVIGGKLKGSTGRAFDAVVNIGIGGSDLGPAMVVEALGHYRNHLDVRFVSNVDATNLVESLHGLDPETTLIIVASKTFTTQETMTNAISAKQWLVDAMGAGCVADHMIALSTNLQAVEEFGIRGDRMFEFWDWVGGRYSLWSAIGMSIMLAIGPDAFDELLSGAYEMDCEVKEHGVDSSSGILALLSVWYGSFFGAESHAILPYDHYLRRFPAFLQQGDMESNGKSVDRSGARVTYPTGTIVWGEPGTNGQHAFYQLIHQGTHLIPCDLIAFAESLNPIGDHHEKLLANCFAQGMALMNGKTEEEVRTEMSASGGSEEEIARVLPFRVFEGNIPSTTLLMKRLTPFSLGQLIAIYEHKILIEGLLLNVFSFDQWGVELGKQLAKPILAVLKGSDDSDELDPSTKSLIERLEDFRS